MTRDDPVATGAVCGCIAHGWRAPWRAIVASGLLQMFVKLTNVRNRNSYKMHGQNCVQAKQHKRTDHDVKIMGRISVAKLTGAPRLADRLQANSKMPTQRRRDIKSNCECQQAQLIIVKRTSDKDSYRPTSSKLRVNVGHITNSWDSWRTQEFKSIKSRGVATWWAPLVLVVLLFAIQTQLDQAHGGE